ncbi:MAG: PilZ domain-containing protein [Desulfobacterales bacterium]
MIQSVFVNVENQAVFTCPQCTKSRAANVSRFLNQKNNSQIKIKCSCGHIFEAILERRKFYRKKTRLHGTASSEKTKKQFLITVVNLSRSGLEFKTRESHLLSIGEHLWVEFTLDNNNKSLIQKKIAIKRIKKDYVGAEFCLQDEYDKILGFYFFK